MLMRARTQTSEFVVIVALFVVVVALGIGARNAGPVFQVGYDALELVLSNGRKPRRQPLDIQSGLGNRAQRPHVVSVLIF